MFVLMVKLVETHIHLDATNSIVSIFTASVLECEKEDINAKPNIW